MNNLAPMKNCPGGVQGNLNWMPGYQLDLPYILTFVISFIASFSHSLSNSVNSLISSSSASFFLNSSNKISCLSCLKGTVFILLKLYNALIDYAQMDSSFWFDKIYFVWFIVYIEGSHVIIS